MRNFRNTISIERITWRCLFEPARDFPPYFQTQETSLPNRRDPQPRSEFTAHLRCYGRLKRPPRGYAAEHAYIEDLKRKDFIAISEFPISGIRSAEFIDEVAARFATAKPLMKFLCAALNLRF